jgi:glycosyltransferase involved in cell wall biosynthesis
VRLLYLADIRFPLDRANGRQTMETAHALARRGHEVVLAVRPDSKTPARDPFAFYGLAPLGRLQIVRAPTAGPPWLRRIRYLCWAVARTARGPRPDVIVTRDLGVAAVLLRLPGRAPLAFESHGYAPVFAETLPDLVSGARRGSRRKLARLARREALVWRRADGYVATTRILADEMTARHGARRALDVIPNAVHIDPRTTVPAAAAAGPGPPVIAYAGHLYQWKGVDVFVRALAELPDVRGLIVGGRAGDADMLRLTALVADLGLADRVELTGFLPAADVPGRLTRASVFVLPTVGTPSARYTSPLKMFEYMALGRPIVASDLPPVREILDDGVSARLVPPGDPSALAAAVRALLADPATAARLAAAARDRVAAFSWDRRAERLEQVLIEARQPRR